MKTGKLVVISAPSGSGKTTIIKHLLQKELPLEFSVSATSRDKRTGEENGKDYYFLTADDFRNKIQQEAFLEWEEVYPGKYYGTLKSELQRIWEKGSNVIFDVDVQGGISIKSKYPEKTLAVFIRPPSVNELEKRLKNRNLDSEEIIRERIQKAEAELSFESSFDVTVVNDNLPQACSETYKFIKEFLQEQ